MIPACRVVVSGLLEIGVSSGSHHLRLFGGGGIYAPFSLRYVRRFA